MADEKLDRAKLVRLLGAFNELQTKQAEILTEIDVLIGGGVSMGSRIKQFEGAWALAWGGRYGSDYLFVPTRDKAQEKRLLKAFDLEDLVERMAVYIKNDDPFYLKNRHSFGIFVSSINAHVPPARATAIAVAAVDCVHVPRCASDVIHTKRKLEEMRG